MPTNDLLTVYEIFIKSGLQQQVFMDLVLTWLGYSTGGYRRLPDLPHSTAIPSPLANHFPTTLAINWRNLVSTNWVILGPAAKGEHFHCPYAVVTGWVPAWLRR